MVGSVLNHESDIVAAIGRDKTILLEKAYGGRRKYIAQKMTDDSDIVKCIGKEAALILARHFGGMQLYIPQTLALIERNKNIVADRHSGKSTRELAQHYGLVDRTIRKICEYHLTTSGLRARNRLKVRQRDSYGRQGSEY